MAARVSAQSDARNARARAAGFTSYSQQYRARKAGYNSASAYRATIAAKGTKGAAVQRAAASGRLLGGRQTAAGLVIAARVLTTRRGGLGGPQVSLQWQQIKQHPNSHVGIDVETKGGKVLHLGQKRGGYSVRYLRELVKAHGTWIAAVLELMGLVYEYDSDDQPTVITVTIR